MTGETSIPSRTVVTQVVAALRDAGLQPAIGGSALIAALGIETSIRDWDVTVDAAEDAVEEALNRAGILYTTRIAGDGPYATRARYLIDGGDHEIDLAVRFAVRTADEVVPINTRVTRHWNFLPIGDPIAWAFAYATIGRAEPAQLLKDWLADQKAES